MTSDEMGRGKVSHRPRDAIWHQGLHLKTLVRSLSVAKGCRILGVFVIFLRAACWNAISTTHCPVQE